MAYRVRFERNARKALDECSQVYVALGPKIEGWLGKLAEKAERKEDSETQDILDALERGLDELEVDNPKRQIERQASIFWKRWKDASLLAKVKALLTGLKNRQSPWRLTYAVQRFRFAGDACTCDVDVFYEIDDVRKWIIVREFAGLPTQG